MPPEGRGGPGAGFTVSLRDVYDALMKLASKVDGMAGAQTTIADHEQRLRGLERWRYALPTSLILAAGSVIVSVLLALWKG